MVNRLSSVKGDLEKSPSFLNVKKKHWDQPGINMGSLAGALSREL